MNTSASILRRLRPHLLSQGTTHRFLSYYVPVAVRRRQKLEALKSLREALHADTVMRSSEQDSSAMGNNNTTTVETPSVSTLSDPTLETVKQLPTSFRHLDNSTLMILASIDNPPLFKARSEYLKRHVMSVDNIDYNQACTRVEEIEETSRQNMTFTALPYQLGIGAALATSIISTPLIFHYDSVAWFNENYVTSDNPEPKDLETMLEVGGWSWSWMEPVIGQVSFILLCLQFARAQMHNLGLKPYTEKVAALRAERLCKRYPMYDRGILTSYSKAITYY